jgi:hypothetical protein
LWLLSWLELLLLWWCIVPITNTAPALKSVKNTSSTASKAEKAIQSITKDRAEALSGFGQLAQVPLIALKQYADCGAVSLYWEGIAGEVAKLAETQPAVANVIDPLIKVGPYTGLITAVLPFILQIGVNHKLLSPGAMGTVPATALSAQAESSLAKQELEALTVQRDAEKEAAAVRAEIAESRRALADVQTDATGN